MTIGSRRWLGALALAATLFVECAAFGAESTSKWIVVYKTTTAKTKGLQHWKSKTRRDFKILPAIAATLTTSDLARMRKDSSVASITRDFVRHKLSTTRGTASTTSEIVPYGVDMVHARDVWPYTRGSGAIIADIDTGIDLSHVDLPKIAASATFTSAAVQDTDGHGTHTAGTMAAPGNDVGVVGVAPDASLLIAKVFDNQGNAQDSDIIAAMDWAVQHGANVINMSLGGSDYDAALNQACANAVAAGVVVVAAAGNDGAGTPSYPGAYPSVISVAAVDQAGQRASWSNYGSTIALCAPGVGVLSTVPTGMGWLVSADWSGVEHQVEPIDGSTSGTVTANVVYCGLGNTADFPTSVRGNIAHIRRGTLTFQAKVNNAVAAGAVGVIISNNMADTVSGTLSGSSSVVVVVVSQANGDDLISNDGISATITSQDPSDYYVYEGTSMSTPHVSGVAALLFGARHGDITPSEVQSAMETSARDLGASGRDDYYGHGLVNAFGALGKVIPLIQSATSSPATVAAGKPVSVTVQLSISTGVESLSADGVALSLSSGVWTGSVPANSTAGLHTIDISLTDNWGNTRQDTSLTYTTSGSASPPTVTISSPSASATSSGPVSYTVTYANATAVTLSAANVTLRKTGTATGTVSVSGSGTTSRKVTISSITGTGALGISIAAGTASGTGGTAPAAGPSTTFAVSSQKPVVAFTSPTTGSTIERNGSSLSIAGTASDTYGISSVTWSLKSGTSGTCSGTTTWSASSIPLSAGQNVLTVSATDTLNNTGTATLTVTYTDSEPGSAWQGIAMVSIPIIPDSTDPKPLVGFSGNDWFSYDVAGVQYIGYPAQESWLSPTSSTPGRGFWARFPSGGGTTPYGTIPSQSEPVAIHLYAGWNLIGDPFISSVPWDIDAITVVESTGTTAVSMLDASDSVDSYAWGWDPVANSYYLVVDADYSSGMVSALSPWQAYWLKAYRECDLILPAP